MNLLCASETAEAKKSLKPTRRVNPAPQGKDKHGVSHAICAIDGSSILRPIYLDAPIPNRNPSSVSPFLLPTLCKRFASHTFPPSPKLVRQMTEEEIQVLLAIRERSLECLEQFIHRRLLRCFCDLLLKEVEIFVHVLHVLHRVEVPALFNEASNDLGWVQRFKLEVRFHSWRMSAVRFPRPMHESISRTQHLP